MKQTETAISETSKQPFEEVEVRRTQLVNSGKVSNKFEILKTIRSNVKITQAQADTLNSGRVESEHNSIFVMYIKKGEKIESVIKNLQYAE